MYGRTNAFSAMKGILTGVVTANSSTGSVLGDVSVSFAGNTATTDSSGVYRMRMKPATGSAVFSRAGYYTSTYPNIAVKSGRTTRLNAILTLITTGKLRGQVTNANNANPISGATVTYETTTIGTFTTTTDSSGWYEFELGVVTGKLTFTATGYRPISYESITVALGETKIYNASLSAITQDYDYKIVLHWGATPNDLDSHLKGPGGIHVYYSWKTGFESVLDVDKTSGYGPETMEFNTNRAGTYKYYVHDYTNRSDTSSTALGSSGARVEIYKQGQSGVEHIYYVPSGTGIYWEVFEVTNGVFTEINRLTSTEPTV